MGKKIGLALLAVPVLSLALAGPASADDPLAGSSSGGAAVYPSSHSTVLRKGDFGRAVTKVQRKLRVSADGVFGQQTHRSVKRFQRNKGLEPDGVVGPKTRRKLHLRPFKASEINHRKRSRKSRVRVPAILKRIAQCESGGNPRAISKGGTYRGKYQFDYSTWRSLGGHGDPAKASESTQDRLALKLYHQSGTRSWPVCGR